MVLSCVTHKCYCKVLSWFIVGKESRLRLLLCNEGGNYLGVCPSHHMIHRSSQHTQYLARQLRNEREALEGYWMKLISLRNRLVLSYMVYSDIRCQQSWSLNEVNIIKEQVSTFLYGVIVTSGASKAGPSSSVHMIALLECFEPIPLVVQLKSLL